MKKIKKHKILNKQKNFNWNYKRKIIKKQKTQKTRIFKGNQKTHIKQTNTKDNEILKTKF